MPFVDRSTLTYPATNAFPVRKWLDPHRSPTSNDFKNFQIFDEWINEINNTVWKMVDRTATSGTWVQFGASGGTGILTITGTSGGPVSADGASNINLLGATNVTVVGNAGTNTLTVTLGGALATSFPTQSGTAIPAAGALTINGAAGITTSGAGSTVTITAGATIPTTFTEDAGSAVPAANNLNIKGAGGITTSGAGSTVTITAGATIPTIFTGNAGSATPAANNLNVLGSGGVTVTGAGSTLTISVSGGGVTWNHITVVGPTAMLVNNGYVADSASQVQLTLPLTSVFGSIIRVVGMNTGGWIVQQNAGQTILNGALTTTAGATGTLAASEPTATIELLCVVADTVWRVIDGNGNLIFT